MREAAEECLEKSKAYAEDAKNAVTIFNVSAHWSQAAELLETGKWLFGLCESGKTSRGFLRRLLGYSRQCAAFWQGSKLAENGLYLSHFQYDLARSLKRAPARESGQGADGLRLQGLASDARLFASLEMGIAWAIYRARIS